MILSLSITDVLSLRVREFSLCRTAKWSPVVQFAASPRYFTGYLSLAVSWERTSCRAQSVDILLSRCSVSYDNFVDRSVFSCLVSIKLATQTPSCGSLSAPILMANYVAWHDTSRIYRSFYDGSYLSHSTQHYRRFT